MDALVPVAHLRECFDLDADAGRLTWKRRPLTHFKNLCSQMSWAGKYAGKEAGLIHHSGYRVFNCRVDERSHKLLAHRVIWAMVNDEWPTFIDHINGVRDDNRIDNLRNLGSRFENGLNRHPKTQPKRPAMGVRQVGQTFRAYITRAGRQIHLGAFADLSSAVAARAAAVHETIAHR